MQPRPPADLPDRQPLDPVHAPDLRPLLHADHSPPPRPRPCSSEGPNPAGRTRPRARWVTFRPAQVGQYSGGADTAPLAPADSHGGAATSAWTPLTGGDRRKRNFRKGLTQRLSGPATSTRSSARGSTPLVSPPLAERL